MKVFALGGSVIEEEWNSLESLAEAIEENQTPCIVVTGAGSLKNHIEKIKTEANQSEQDQVGIQATRLNAETFRMLLNSETPRIPSSLEEVAEKSSNYEIVVTGGLMPGFSTDAVSALIAERKDAEVVFLKNVDGIYSKDPSKFNSERFDEINVDKLRKIKSNDFEAGDYGVIDNTAVNLIERSEIDARVVKGSASNLRNLDQAEGTRILP